VTVPELAGLCAKWQQRLRLQDWEIKIEISRAAAMPEGKNGTVAGCIDYWSAKKFARIQILDPLDYPNNLHRVRDQTQDGELDLVHELLHLWWIPFVVKEGSHQEIAMEQCIHALSTALVDLARQAVPR
jgi:hypothetical protein